jgi:hypothetical protein
MLKKGKRIPTLGKQIPISRTLTGFQKGTATLIAFNGLLSYRFKEIKKKIKGLHAQGIELIGF